MYDPADAIMLSHAVHTLRAYPRLRKITLRRANETWHRFKAVRLRQAGEFEVDAGTDGRPARLLVREKALSGRFFGAHRGPISSRRYS